MPPSSDWREQVLDRVRALIKEAVPEVTEEVKWRKPTNPNGVPAWSLNGMICTGETYKDHLKLTFFKGGSLPDPGGLFKQKYTGEGRRSVDIYEGDNLDETAFKELVRSAASINLHK